MGSHLYDLLRQDASLTIYGTKRPRSSLANLEQPPPLYDCELTDYQSVTAVLEATRPDCIFHLAAQSFVPASFSAPSHTFEVNVLGTLNLLEACRKLKLQPRILVAGSSEEYGHVLTSECPIKESQPLRPLSPYGVSKVAMELLSLQYWRSYGLPVVVTRAFNHTGPRRGEQFVTSSFAKQIAEIEAGGIRNPTIQHGNLEAQRDWLDVRDVVRAYQMAIDQCLPGEAYNICSGQAHSVREVLDYFVRLSSSAASIKLQADPNRMRPSDVVVLLGDSSKFRTLTGWEPAIGFTQTLEDLLNYWRKRVGKALAEVGKVWG